MTRVLRGATPLLVATLALVSAGSNAQAAVAPPLGSAATYAVLGGSLVTNAGASTVNGDLGVSPGSAIIGFPPGTITGTNPDAAAAQVSATTAYNNLAGQTCDTDLTGQDLGSVTLTPGTYCFSTSAQLTGTLTLDGQGNPGAVWVFQIGTTLTTASASSVVIINSGQSCCVFWQVGTSATLGSTTAFAGNIFALVNITLNAGATISGSLFAQTGAVTLDTNNISGPAITLASLPNGIVGVPGYPGLATASGGTGPYTYALTAGSLPTGLSLVAGTGAFTGTPSATGTFTFQITATDASGCTGVRSYSVVIGSVIMAGDLVVREFRLRGFAGAEDEYVEVFNKSAGPLTIVTTPADGSPGFGIVSESAGLLATIPNGTVIPRGGAYLMANSTPVTGYSLSNYGGVGAATHDASWTVDVADNSGIGLFQSASTFDMSTRLDAVGFSSSAALYKEGVGLAPATGITVNGEWVFVRKAPYPTGSLQDTGANVSDFLFVSTNAGIHTVQSALGTPGPQNLSSPRSVTLPVGLADPAAGANSAPNRIQTGNYHYFRRKITNNTGAGMTKLRFRIADLTTLFGVGYVPGGIDWRGITTTPVGILVPGSVTARALTLELPTVPYSATGKGAGYNASFTVDLSDLPSGTLADGASIYVNIGFRNVKGGYFYFLLVPEVLN